LRPLHNMLNQGFAAYELERFSGQSLAPETRLDNG
jgi:hypothetical protein